MLGNKTKYENKIFLRRFPLSRFLAKTQRVNKPAIKKFLKNFFGFDSNLKRTQHEWCEKQGRNPERRVIMENGICMPE